MLKREASSVALVLIYQQVDFIVLRQRHAKVSILWRLAFARCWWRRTGTCTWQRTYCTLSHIGPHMKSCHPSSSTFIRPIFSFYPTSSSPLYSLPSETPFSSSCQLSADLPRLLHQPLRSKLCNTPHQSHLTFSLPVGSTSLSSICSSLSSNKPPLWTST